jgi:glycosyltransferase involved in cell wall biosynthesis
MACVDHNSAPAEDPEAVESVLLVVGGTRQDRMIRPLEAAGLRVHVIDGGQMTICPRALSALPSLRREQFDIIMTHTWTGHAIAARLLGRALDLPVVLRLRGDTWSASEDLLSLRQDFIQRLKVWYRITMGERNVRSLHCIMPVAHWMVELERKRVPNGKAVWLPVHNAVREIPGPPDNPDEVLERWSPDRRPIIASVTNFSYWNKIEPMLEAAPQMAQFLRQHGMRWVIAGSRGMYEDEFFGRLADRCPQQLWHRANFVPEPWLLYYTAWAFLHLSHEEGLPSVVMEAQACGCPVVTNRHPGMSELIDHGRTGLMTDQPDGAAGMLEQLATESNLRDGLIERARQWIRQTHSDEAIGRQMAEVFAQVRAHYLQEAHAGSARVRRD